jgi:LPS export ABC transporter protein LptC
MVFQTKSAVNLFLVAFICFLSCGKSKEVSTVEVDAVALPTIHGENISSLISDSGITRYRLTTKVWDIYSNDTFPYWFFPQGVYLELFDSLFRAQSTVTADTAYFYEKKDLFRLLGNVQIQNLSGEKFETSELFWDRSAPVNSVNAVYTDKMIRIDRGDVILVSRGFRSDRFMNNYRFFGNRTEAIIEEDQAVAD